MAIAKEEKAPDFTLKQKTKDGLIDITLSSNYGSKNTVLLFFPFAFTSVCTDEMCAVSNSFTEYEALDATVYAISIDSPFAQEPWAEANKITIPVLSDFNKDVTRAYDVLYEELLGFKGVAKRSAFVINKEGKIIYSWVSEDPKNIPPFDEIKEALK